MPPRPRTRPGLYGRIAFIAVFALIAAALLAAIQARQLARPLERLARSAGRVGDGDFTTPAAASGIDEIDDIARSLRLSANRVDRMLEAERNFTADATHQLRTGLTGIAIRLELLERHPDPEVATEAKAVLEQTHELNTTLDELLVVARTGSTGERSTVELVDIVDDHLDDWRARFDAQRRQLVVTTGIAVPVSATPGLVGQIFNVMLQNSLHHGSGTVIVLVEGTAHHHRGRGPWHRRRRRRLAVRTAERSPSRSRTGPRAGAAARRVGRRPIGTPPSTSGPVPPVVRVST